MTDFVTGADGVERCEACGKRRPICVCDRIEPTATRTRVLILQHPQEPDVELGTARLLPLALPSATLRVGLSWPSLEATLEGVLPPERVDRAKWAAIFPSKLAKDPGPLAKGEVRVVDRHGERVGSRTLDGIVVLDGTWSQAKTLWWRNPWLLKLGRVLLRPAEPTIYGRLRKAPRAEWVSTLEAVADALVGVGEPPEVRDRLRRLMRTMVQRARDAGANEPPPSRSPRG